ncbi:conjugal transfer protein TraG N-terminal domain-containing protein [Eoetvoesiella caeni]
MGNWTIYSVGDAAFLEQILISVAMVTGTNDFTRAASIGLLLGIILMGFQSVMRGAKEFNVQQMFVGWVVFMCLFAPTTTVIIEDNVSGDTRVVANVPFGVGAAGGMISTIGYKLTALFEQGYGYIAPYVTETHFADSLNLLNKVRTAAYNPKLMMAIDENLAPGASFRESWDNYIRECTLTKIDLGIASVDGLISQPMPEALRFDSSLFGTRIFLDGSTGRDVDCADGYSQLLTATNQGISSNYIFSRALGQALGTETPEKPSSDSAVLKVTDALQALRFSSYGAIDFVKAAVLKPVYEQAVLGKYQDMNDISSAIMINQAIQQRNTQWASEQSMFMTVVRPMQTFFEGFVYAITPLMAVLMIAGSFGMSLAFKYLQTLFWIQLWLPILSIINLYISTAAAGEMSVYDDTNMTSMYALSGINDVLQNWIATGGMLAAATPVISLFVVTGSTYAMTSIAGRIGGSDHINEKTSTPDVVQPAPFMQNQAVQMNNPLTGTMMTGSEQIVGNTTVGSALTSAVGSAKATQHQAQEAFSKDVSRTYGSMGSQEQRSGFMNKIGQNTASGHSTQHDMLQRAAASLAKSHQLSDSSSQQLLGAMGVNAGTGGGKGIGIGYTGQDTSSQERKISSDEMLKTLKEHGWGDQDSISWSSQLAHQFEGSNGTTFGHTITDSQQESLKKTSSDLTSANETFTQAQQLQQNLGASATMKLNAIGGLMSGEGQAAQTAGAKEALSDLNGFFNSNMAGPAMQAAALEKENLYRNLGMPAKTAQITARLDSMLNPSNSKAGDGAASMQAAAGIMAKATAQGASPTFNPYENSNLSKPGLNSAGLKNEVNGATQDGATQAYVGQANSGALAMFDQHSADPTVTASRGSVGTEYDGLYGNHQDKVAATKAEVAEEKRGQILKNMAAQQRDGLSNTALVAGIFQQQLKTSGTAADSILNSTAYGAERANQRSETSMQVQADYGLPSAMGDYYAAVRQSNDLTGSMEHGKWQNQLANLRSNAVAEAGGDQAGEMIAKHLELAARSPEGKVGNYLREVGSYVNAGK